MSERRKRLQLTFLLWPLGWGAVAINLFFLSLIGSWLGFPVMPPHVAALVALPLGLPVSWGFARHFRALVRKVDAELEETDQNTRD